MMVKDLLVSQPRDKLLQTQRTPFSPQRDLSEEDSKIQTLKKILSIFHIKLSEQEMATLGLKLEVNNTHHHKLVLSF